MGVSGSSREQLVERDVSLHGRRDDAQRRAVLMRLEAALPRLRERHQHQVVPAPADTRRQRDVGQRLDIRARATDERDGVGVAHADQGEGRLGQQIVEHEASILSAPCHGPGDMLAAWTT